jgi:prepilin-type N-terminal cleavage/methylation domain-containing protein
MREGANIGAGSLSREDGFTLIEVLVAAVLGLVIVGAGVTMFTAVMRAQPGQASKGASIQQARTTEERIVRELRQGASVYTATAQQLSFITYVNSATCGGAPGSTSIACRVTYTCAAGTCTRVEARPDGTNPGPARTVATGLSSSSVFTYSPSSSAPSYIGATLVFPGKSGGSDDAITLSDGATLMNPSPAT